MNADVDGHRLVSWEKCVADGMTDGGQVVIYFAGPRNGLPFRPYVYRGTGEDQFTAFMDDDPVELLPSFRPLKPCGTPAAYRRHLRHNERDRPCMLPGGACREAERFEYQVRAAS